MATGQAVHGAVEELVACFKERLGKHYTALVNAGVTLEDLRNQRDALVEVMAKALPAASPTAADVSGPVWTTEQVRVALGKERGPITRQAVDDRVRRGTLMALRVRGDRERAYPLWQFQKLDGAWQVVPGLAAVLRVLPENVVDRWTVASWMRQPNPSLNSETPLQRLQREGDASDRLLEVADATAQRWAH